MISIVHEKRIFRRIVGGDVVEMLMLRRPEGLEKVLLRLGDRRSEPDADVGRYQVHEAKTNDGVVTMKRNLDTSNDEPLNLDAGLRRLEQWRQSGLKTGGSWVPVPPLYCVKT
jgi:hypothetical protein